MVTRTLPCRIASWLLLPFVLGALNVPAAHAGQVRVNVGSNFFAPYAANVNEGDHVVWVWISGGHTVTNWTLPADSVNGGIDGSIFDSEPGGLHFGLSNQRFSWKSDRTGHVPYVCVPHMSLDMTGRVIVAPLATPPTVPVADFRITEVLFNEPSGKDLVEIANLGAAAGNLGRFRLARLGTGTGVEIALNDFPVPAGGRVTIHANETGANDPANIYLSELGNLGDVQGSVALYVPSSLSFQNALTNADMMLDFVQWGAGGQVNEGTANTAGFWTPGTSIDNVAVGHSIEYCQNATLDHGVDRWAEISPPNFGSNGNCTTPTVFQSWGRLKIIYRE
ncbi:MAG: plastocyanin/azurin family copper-binding protein [Candidatus Eiseniibacteriota bacterium]